MSVSGRNMNGLPLITTTFAVNSLVGIWFKTMREPILSGRPPDTKHSAHFNTSCLSKVYLRSSPHDHSMPSDCNSVSLRPSPLLTGCSDGRTGQTAGKVDRRLTGA